MNEGPGLPIGWTWASLDAIASHEPGAITDGPFGSNLKTDHYTSSGPRVIRLQNIGEGEFRDEHAHVSVEHFARLSRHEARAADVVVAMLGEKLPRACVVPDFVGPAIVKADCARVRVHPRAALSKFVSSALNSEQVRREARSLIHGIGRPRLGLGLLRELRIPLAPNPEQRRIVDAIESCNTRIDETIATLDRVRRNLKRYRASVLKAAVEGRLVPAEAELARAQNRDYEPASKLLERILAGRRQRQTRSWREGEFEKAARPAVMKATELPEGWCWASVGMLCEAENGRGFRKTEWRSGGLPIIRIENLKDDSAAHNYYQGSLEPKHRVQHGDLLFAWSGTPGTSFGAHVWRGKDAALNQHIFNLRFDRGLFDVDFFRFALNNLVAGYVAGAHGGVGLAHITKSKFLAGVMPLPPLAEQNRIGQRLAAAFSEADAVEVSVRNEVLRLARLRQSILKWAFEGKLVDQDPTDEPASVLLERIEVERAAAAPPHKSRANKPRAKVIR